MAASGRGVSGEADEVRSGSREAKPFTVGIQESELVHVLGMEDPAESLGWLLGRVEDQLEEIRAVLRELHGDNPELQQQVKAEADRLAGMRRRIRRALAGGGTQAGETAGAGTAGPPGLR